MEENQVLGIFASAGTIGRSFLTMPRVPPDRVDALRQAFDAMLKDADFLGEIGKSHAEFGPMGGAARSFANATRMLTFFSAIQLG